MLENGNILLEKSDNCILSNLKTLENGNILCKKDTKNKR